MSGVSANIPAGTYWVGDPCYAFEDHELWLRLLTSGGIDRQSIPRVMECSADGARFVASSTAHGDGTYKDQQGREYPVDAGLIGVVPARPGVETPWGMHEVEFEQEFTVGYMDGAVTIDTITIDTDPRFECDALHCNTEIEEYEDYCPDCAEEVAQ